MHYVPDPLFLPVGNTDEASASGGGDSRLYSPFSALYSPSQAANEFVMQQSTARPAGSVRSNPQSAALKRVLREGLRDLEDIKGSVTTVPLYLGLAGFIVRREWASAQSLCRAIIRYLEKAAEMTRKGKSLVKLKAKSEVGTYYTVLRIFDSYLTQIRKGQEPGRTVVVKKGKKSTTVYKSIWDSIYDCCLAVSGNTKLPFVAYSEFPIATCPGAGGVSLKYGNALSGAALGNAVLNDDPGGCGSFCYSIKALSYPATVARLLLLSLGATLDPARHVDTVMNRMVYESQTGNRPRIMRLFVDGDFRDVTAVEEWMRACKMLSKHGITIYGYSKSWRELLETHKRNGSRKSYWPSNFVLNLSSGSVHSDQMKAKIAKLPIARGGFSAIDPFVRVVEKTYEQKEGPVKGRRMAAAVLAAYERAKKAAENAVAQTKQLSGPGSGAAKRKARQALKNVDLSLHRRLKRYAPDLYAAWEQYEREHKALEKKIGAYNKVVKSRVEAVKGKAAKDAVKQTALVPGTALQAMTWRLLVPLVNKGEFACPIDCGRCPMAAIKGHDAVIRNLLSVDNAEALVAVQQAFQTSMARPFFARTQRMHACGDSSKRGVNILIGLH